MPAFIGPIEIERVLDGAFKIGDTFSISPKASLKFASGAGVFNTGDCIRSINVKNQTYEYNPNLSDQAQTFNK